MLPIEVMHKAQAEFLDYNNMGASVIEISHRSKEFGEIIDRSDALLRELAIYQATTKFCTCMAVPKCSSLQSL